MFSLRFVDFCWHITQKLMCIFMSAIQKKNTHS